LVVVAGAGSEEEMICPRCHCDDVYFTRFSRRMEAMSVLLLGFIVPVAQTALGVQRVRL
jgi:hypothetical protein